MVMVVVSGGMDGGDSGEGRRQGGGRGWLVTRGSGSSGKGGRE